MAAGVGHRAVDRRGRPAVDLVKVYGSGDTAVRALDEVTVELPAGRFTAIMGPSGSGKSTLMHCLAGLDSPTAGQVCIGDVDLGELSRPRAHAPAARARSASCSSRSTCCRPSTALENITLPLTLAGRGVDRDWLDVVVDTVGLGDRLRTARPSCRAASSSASPWPGRWPAGRRSSSPTSPPATSTRGPAPRCWRSCAARSTSSGRRSSWSPTTRAPRPTPTRSCSSPTAGSSTSIGGTDGRPRARPDQGAGRLTCASSCSAGCGPARGGSSAPSSPIFLGVAFLAGTLVLGDTLRRQLRPPVRQANAGTDVVVRNATDVDDRARRRTAGRSTPVRSTPCSGVDGVADAAAERRGLRPDRRCRRRRCSAATDRRPSAGNWIDDPDAEPLPSWPRAGRRAPTTRSSSTAAPPRTASLHLGDRIEVQVPQPVEMTLVGISTFGGTDGLGP